MKHFLWLLAILIIAVPVAAQDGTVSTSNTTLGAVDVTNVTITRTENNQLTLTIFGNPVSCDMPVVEQSRHTYRTYDDSSETQMSGELVDVHITTRPPAEGEVCNFVVPFSHTVDLEGSFETDSHYILTINNFTAWIFLVRPGQVVMDMEIQQVDVGDTELMGWLNSEVLIDTVAWDTSDGTYVANVSGSLPDGCAAPTFGYITQDTLKATEYEIELFRILPLAVACPAMLVNFDISIPTNISIDEEVSFELGNKFYTKQTANDDLALSLVMQRFIAIETVDITGADGAYEVQVNGTQMGDCGAPLQEVAGTTGAFSTIEIYDLVPEAAPCTRNFIPYENTFTVSQLPVVVNGNLYFGDESDSNLPAEGNNMQVDTVIEDVGIEVLESFPMQVVITVTGYQPDGCDFPVEVDQSRTDDTVTVHIYREVPPNVRCTMNIVPYEERIQLEGGFTGDSVTVIINGETYTFDL